MDPANAMLLDCVLFVACGSGGLVLGVVLAHGVPDRYVANLWPASPPKFYDWAPPVPELPPPAGAPTTPVDEGAQALVMLLGGIVLLSLLGAALGATRRGTKP